MNHLLGVPQLNDDLVLLPGRDAGPQCAAPHPGVEPVVVLWTPPSAGPDSTQGRRDGLAGQVPELGRQAPQHVGVQHGLGALVHVPHHTPGLGQDLQHLHPAVKE